MKLNTEARTALDDAGVSVAAFVRHWFGPDATTWRGDACGCPDDRCIGHHHDPSEDCLCRPVVVKQAAEAVQCTVTDLRRGRALLNRAADDAVLEGRAPEAFPGHRDLLHALRAVQSFASEKATVTALCGKGAALAEIETVQDREGHAWGVLVTVLFDLVRKANR